MTAMNDANFYRLIMSRRPTDLSRPLIEWIDRIYSWADMETISTHFSTLLTSLGCMKGDRVVVQVDKSPAALFLYLACLRAGLAFVPMNTAYHADEVEYRIRDAKPTVVVVSPAVAPLAESIASRYGIRHVLTLAANGSGSFPMSVPTVSCQPCPCAPDDVAAILYTSGTTGQPKGAVLSHRNLAVNGETLRTSWAFTADDILLHALPIDHTHGLFVACHCALLSGARMIWLPAFDRTQVLVHLPRATVFMGVPTYYTRLLAMTDFTAATCTRMRLFVSGSAPLLPETFLAFQRRTGHAILERYGMTETGMNTSNPYHGERQPGHVGKPLPGVSVRVVGVDGTLLPRGQIGVLQVRGDNVFLGYWEQPKEMNFTSDAWFITGDLAYIGDDETLTLVGRASDLIISGGYNVYPREVEQVINSLSGVIESAVIGLPHPDFGEAVVVVVQAGQNRPTTESILSSVRARLANYKVPKAIVFVDKLPHNPMGKVQKNLLRQTYATMFVATSVPS
ncbi:Long-chain-fatty-acid--CoA ligase [invertebrate metagenome]|uniref:Long-chain-fatty-acid--CoA ligase n=1 Tax=invertebrate metagenome TaxID=1711999 RepID=A0A484H5G3_9ZZZZ